MLALLGRSRLVAMMAIMATTAILGVHTGSSPILPPVAAFDCGANAGGMQCKDACCSKFGYCGTTLSYCGVECQSAFG